jgi:KDO2-lipid IV(A) lauroyltransferase
MKISHGIEFLAALFLVKLFQFLPRRSALAFGSLLGRIVHRLWKRRRTVVMNNLRIAFGEELNESERKAIARRVFVNIGKTLAEIARFPVTSSSELRSFTHLATPEVFDETRARGKGCIIASGHFSNWEIAGYVINDVGYTLDFLVEGQHNPYFDNLLTRLRESCGVKVHHSDRGGMKEVLKTLRRNEIVAIVSDQHAGSRGIIVRFFGRLVSVPRAPAALSYRTGAAIVVGYDYRQPDDTHVLRAHAVLYPRRDAPEQSEIYRLTSAYTAILEEQIRAHPDLWLWTHRRFKYTPPEEQTEGTYVENNMNEDAAG